jgi:hypothetical protein
LRFLVGQTGNRAYEEGQRAPGDWEVICSQRRIAVHALENLATSDTGVVRYRRLLRDALAGKTGTDTTMRAGLGGPIHQYAQDSVLSVPRRPGGDDKALLLELDRKILALMQEADAVPRDERDRHVRRGLDELERQSA